MEVGRFAGPWCAPRLLNMVTVAVAGLVGMPLHAVGAGYRTANFVVEAPTDSLARKIGDAAEQYRHDLAIEWTGRPLPRWARPCPIQAQVQPGLGAGGATSFVFDKGEVFNWQMTIQGSEDRVLDSVLPHEITHTIFASHFRQPLPRWADEGACTTVEHPVERARQHKLLIEFLTTGRGIAFPKMFAMREYPPDVLPLYSQGYSLARFLIERGGRHRFVAFVRDGLEAGDWASALSGHYGVANPVVLQDVWLDWVRKGCPAPPASVAGPPARPVGIASVESTMPRGQSPDPVPPSPPPAAAATAGAPGRRSIYSLAANRSRTGEAGDGNADQTGFTPANSRVRW